MKSRSAKWEGHVARKREKGNAYRLLVGKPEGKKSLGRPRRRSVNNIRMDRPNKAPWNNNDNNNNKLKN
jgi:hypothetical protein